jgi:hypothetical protein
MTQGVIVEGNCQVVPNSVTYGEITLRNISIEGNRYASISRPFIDIQTVNNVTLDSVTLKSYILNFEFTGSSINVNTYNNCIVSAYDGRTKNI